jgi:C4-dicarboxylate-specific signal transduction histidine kinase
MRRVLTNILGNALDAVGTNGRVQVVVAHVRRRVEVAISDSGPGIDDDMREAVFRPFMTTKENGTGLGLAISEAVIRALGGRIRLDCGPLGGARFRILIPEADTIQPPKRHG